MADSDDSFASSLRAAAAALCGAAADPRALPVLRQLGYDDGDTAAAPARARMLRAAACFRRLFRLPMPDAPGVVFFGAEIDPASLGPIGAGVAVGGSAGSALDAGRAFESCVGEGIEYLSQFAQPDDAVEYGTVAAGAAALDPATRGFLEAVAAVCRVPSDRAVGWARMRRLSDQAECRYPADLCLRRADADFAAPLKLSTGCAAGLTRADATLRGLFELIERDALGLWWRGGRRARAIVTETEAWAAATGLLAQVRQGAAGRETRLLDITTDVGVPVVAAFSVRADGYGFAFGLGCRTSLAQAAGSAIFEMCQSELSLHVIEAKRVQSGEAALNDSDRRQRARATSLDTRRCLLLQPDGGAAEAEAADVSLETILRRLTELGIVAYSMDLTRPRFGVPVIRVIAPALQNEPCRIDSGRLVRMIAETGGGARFTGGIKLL